MTHCCFAYRKKQSGTYIITSRFYKLLTVLAPANFRAKKSIYEARTLSFFTFVSLAIACSFMCGAGETRVHFSEKNI